MKKGEHIEGVAASVAFPNKGKVICDEGTVTVKNVIPGQTLDVRINKGRRTPLLFLFRKFCNWAAHIFCLKVRLLLFLYLRF